MSSEATVLPCPNPWCHSREREHPLYPLGIAEVPIVHGRIGFRLRCIDCGLCGPIVEKKADAYAAWNHRQQAEARATSGAGSLALRAIKAVTATAKDGAAGLSRIMAITRAAGVEASYSDLLADPDVALVVERPRTEWAHLFKPGAEGCALPPIGWRCTRARGHSGPCAVLSASTTEAPGSEGAGWRTMEGAPKDGTAVLLHFAGLAWPGMGELRTHVERHQVGWYSDGRWWEGGTGHDLFETFVPKDQFPTHWMPLPAAPTRLALNEQEGG